ncbi:hypothetical protein BKA83DRAFT_4286400 [Pisolithus microcarpus]|nr:hypothetical protein BKA83DRAFT_4286400 [Pisolithus microcarpus]
MTQSTKFIVAIVWILDTLHVSFMCHMLYYYLITNYGVPTSLEYIVWFASIFETTLVVTIVQLFFANMIYRMSRRKLRWLVTAPIVLLVLLQLAATAVTTLVNNAITYACTRKGNFTKNKLYYTAFPAVFTILLAEVLNTVSLCVLLYEKGSRSAVPRTKRLLNTLIIYAVNRCLLTLSLVVRMTYCKATMALSPSVQDAEILAAWTMALNFLTPKRQSLGSSLDSDRGVNAVNFANPPKLSGDTGSSKDEVKQFDRCKVAVIDIATRGTFDEATTPQREVEV